MAGSWGAGGENKVQELSLKPWKRAGLTHLTQSLFTVLPQVSGHLDYAKQMDVILKAVGIPTKPGWDEKGLLAPGSLAQEGPSQMTSNFSSVETPTQDGLAPNTPPEHVLKETATTDPNDHSTAQMPAVLGPSEGASQTATASLQTCSHGMSNNPLGCPDCACETQGPHTDQD